MDLDLDSSSSVLVIIIIWCFSPCSFLVRHCPLLERWLAVVPLISRPNTSDRAFFALLVCYKYNILSINQKMIIINRPRSDRRDIVPLLPPFTLHLIRQEHPEEQQPQQITIGWYALHPIYTNQQTNDRAPQKRLTSAIRNQERGSNSKNDQCSRISQNNHITIRISVELHEAERRDLRFTIIAPWIFPNQPQVGSNSSLRSASSPKSLCFCVWFRLYSIQVAKHSIFVKVVIPYVSRVSLFCSTIPPCTCWLPKVIFNWIRFDHRWRAAKAE